MSKLFQMNFAQLHFLQSFLRDALSAKQDVPNDNGDYDTDEVIESLQSKGYLSKLDNVSFSIDESLRFLISVTDDPWGTFVMEDGGNNKEKFFFKNDAIVWLGQTGSQLELMWIPFLPFAIGRLAGKLEPFLNAETALIEKHPAEAFETVFAKYLNSGYRQQWRFSISEKGVSHSNERSIVLTNGNEQVMLQTLNGELIIWAPAKADYVNALTKLFAPIHARAIENGGVLYEYTSN